MDDTRYLTKVKKAMREYAEREGSYPNHIVVEANLYKHMVRHAKAARLHGKPYNIFGCSVSIYPGPSTGREIMCGCL